MDNEAYEQPDLDMIGVKVICSDGSELEPSSWAVAFVLEEDGQLHAKCEWSRRPQSAVEIAVLGAAIEGLLREYTQSNQGVLLLFKSRQTPGSADK